MQSTIIVAALGILAIAGCGLTAWGMWLEHRTEQRLLDIIAAALESGRTPPPELLAKLAGEQPGGGGATPRRALLRTAVLLLGLAVAFFLASWAVDDNGREQALLLLASISGLSGVAMLGVRSLGSRVGL